MSEILGTYLSRYQGKITAEAVGRMIGQNVRFIGIRLTSGAGYIDPTWEHNAAMLRDTSILLFPWHFVTTEAASAQHKNFMAQVEQFDRWRLPPGLDCEAYSSTIGGLTAREAYGLAYPTEATVDAIGRWLTEWMASQDELAEYDYPAIYTNQSSGNKIFKTAAMARYLLWVANWHNPSKPPLTQPNKPKVWANVPHYIWQDAIIDGAPYGIQGQVSHELWGPLLPFPDDDEPEPPPDEDTIEMTIRRGGQIYTGTLKEK